MDDFDITQKKLRTVAGSLADCQNPRLKEQGYKRNNFKTHRYFMLYRIEDGKAIVDNIFHELQDYEDHLC